MGMWFVWDEDKNEEKGPVSLESLKESFVNGDISESSLVRKDTVSKWGALEASEAFNHVTGGKGLKDSTGGQQARHTARVPDYIESNLSKGEDILYRTKLHWIIYAPPAFLSLVALLFIADLESAFFIIIILVPIWGLCYIARMSSEYGITNKRLILKYGIIRRQTQEILLTKAESIQVDQDILGRMLDYGTIRISGTGSSENVFPKIEQPLEFRRQFQEAIDSISD